MGELVGQLILVHNATGFWSRVIQVVQSFAQPPHLSRWNHVGIAISDTHMVEASGGGCRTVRIDRYDDIAVSRLPETHHQRVFAAKWAAKHAKAHTPYAYLDVFTVGVSLLLKKNTPEWILRELSNGKSYQCASFVDAALRAANIHLFRDGRPIAAVYPASIAELFDYFGWLPADEDTP